MQHVRYPLVITHGSRKILHLVQGFSHWNIHRGFSSYLCLMTLETTFSYRAACCRIFSPNASWSVAACGTAKTSDGNSSGILKMKWWKSFKNGSKCGKTQSNPVSYLKISWFLESIYLCIYVYVYIYIYVYIYMCIYIYIHRATQTCVCV